MFSSEEAGQYNGLATTRVLFFIEQLGCFMFLGIVRMLYLVVADEACNGMPCC